MSLCVKFVVLTKTEALGGGGGECQTSLIKNSRAISCKATIGVTIVQTLLSLWVHFPPPPHPRDNVVFLSFARDS